MEGIHWKCVHNALHHQIEPAADDGRQGADDDGDSDAEQRAADTQNGRGARTVNEVAQHIAAQIIRTQQMGGRRTLQLAQNAGLHHAVRHGIGRDEIGKDGDEQECQQDDEAHQTQRFLLGQLLEEGVLLGLCPGIGMNALFLIFHNRPSFIPATHAGRSTCKPDPPAG